MRPQGNINLPRDQRDYIKGISSSVPYFVRNPSGDWTNFYDSDSWVDQLYEGKYDTNCCWLFQAVDRWEQQLEWLHINNQFSSEALNFFQTNGYFDSAGHFDLSRRYLAIKSGVRNQGNTQIASPKLLSMWGILPSSTLDYNGSDFTYFQFLSNYFNPEVITPEMDAIAKQFLNYVNVAYEWIGGGTTPPLLELKANLLQAPLGIGIPIPKDISEWNSNFIQYDGSTVVEHAVDLIAINDDGSYKILDQYNPSIKTLSKDYYIPMVDNTVLTAINPANPLPINQSAPVPSFWASIVSFWKTVFGNLSSISP